MNYTEQFSSIRRFTDSHHPAWMDIIRMLLGVAIFIKGIYFIQSPDELLQILQNSKIAGWTFIVEHHVAFTYLVGGILIAIGLITRIAIIFQLPVFFGSIFCCLTDRGFFSVFSDLTFSIVMFVLLIFFLIWGPGKISVDAEMKKPSDFDNMPQQF
jgi:uncharacterized membrane protein YphA (DoxX/SURF4 family)